MVWFQNGETPEAKDEQHQKTKEPEEEVQRSGLTDLVRRERLSAGKGLSRPSFQGSPNPLYEGPT
jgi:hypothetical protein